MTKFYKISALVVAMATILTMTFSTKAADDSLVTLTVTDTASDCTLADYTLPFTASVSEGTSTDGQTVTCNLLRNAAQAITLGSNDLVSSLATITAANVAGSGSTLTEGGTLTSATVLANGELSGAPTMYSKSLNQIGVMTQLIDITATIYAGAPAATYTGQLDISIPNN